MLSKLVNRLLRCSHSDYSFPITLKSEPMASQPKGTYVVCLDCGQELSYDWSRMQVSAPTMRPTWTNLHESAAR